MDSYKKREYRKKGLLSPRCAYLLSGPKRGEGGGEGLLEREGEEGGGGLIPNHVFSTKFTTIFQTLLLHQ